MKRKLSALIAVLFLLTVGVQGVFAAKKRYSDSIPKLDRKGVTYFTRDNFDKKYRDNIRFVSRTDDRVSFDVWAYNENTRVWFLYGSAILKFYDDTCFVEEEGRFDLKQYNYFAIEPNNRTEYTYSYDVRHNDIYITVKDKR